MPRHGKGLHSPEMNQYLILRAIGRQLYTQAGLSRLVELSVAMINVYMQALRKRKLIFYDVKSPKTVYYSLTPAGATFAEKARLELIEQLKSRLLDIEEPLEFREISDPSPDTVRDHTRAGNRFVGAYVPGGGV